MTVEPESSAKRGRGWRRGLWLVPLCAVGLWPALLPEPRPPAPPAPAAAQEPDRDFSKFEHTSAQHARLPCLLCHRRPTNEPRPNLPGHTPCSACHEQQFADAASPICTICHADPRSGVVRPFPPLRSFDVVFDHATHTRGAARPREGCATCHTPERRGVVQSIPAGLTAHTLCFGCHEPRAESGGKNLSSCAVCHRAGGYSRTPELARTFKVGFSHADHRRASLGCAECHTVRAGMAQSRQVASPFPAEHHAPSGAQSCTTCHNGRRAFGAEDFSACKRCHEGKTWHF